ncbi:sugar-transfer associated ATP-grasp domain-containing protein [Fulvivirga lutea]|uniref:Alpha-L-glutamate ligase-related protein ATP-grasp domain-containing protein n=1 Tax=Fulvivirga lutea TaxID=2810512 RepID=A0A974WGK5_9BACT|nr:sugar-transfer associated ATP-grasp domain-containing protein [Fulvivirga lutea]QSE96802.1 hypothetical protein JR347_14545 [Fulvivirga lutea]
MSAVINFIKGYYRWAATFSKVVRREAQTLTAMPLTARIKMWCGGFFSAAYYRYEFYKGENKPNEYVSDYQENLRASRINSRSSKVYVDDKIMFPLFFGKFCPVVYNYAFINNGLVIPQTDEFKISDIDDVLHLIKSGQDVVVKPAYGSRGGQVHTISNQSTVGFIWNGQPCSDDELKEELPKLDLNIICPLIKQASYSREFYPRTTNTVRILTMVDPITNQAFIAHAVQRIGTEHSYPVDNFAVGGITCNIDIPSGKIGKGSYIIPTESRKNWYTKHPETGVQIEGVQIPNWEKIKDGIVNLANSVSFLKVIGWDIVVLDNEVGYVMLEGNNAPCYKVHQLHGGFLKDERILKFMKAYKVI